MHMQTSVDRWIEDLLKMPDYTLVKAVNDLGVLLDAYNKWVAAGRDPKKLYLDYRYHDYYYPDWDGRDNTKTYDEFKQIWRMNFSKVVDWTYYAKYAHVVKFMEELNEYTDTRMVTDKALLAPRIRSARAAVVVWNSEYRGKNGIPSDARLVVCNSPVGNDIPIEYFQLCRDEDAVLGVHTYTHWVNKQRDPLDFRYHSGRPFYNEQQYGIKVNYILSESGPYDGSTRGGWRVGNCMGGSIDLLKQGMIAWWTDLAATDAYKEGRIKGPGAWFTCNRVDDGKWKYYLLWHNELSVLAQECAKIWKPGTGVVVPPDPIPVPTTLTTVCDVSRHQNRKDATGTKPIEPIDFSKMKAQGAKGCYIRGTIGSSSLDDAFVMNWQAIEKVPGFPNGMYHLFNSVNTVSSQIDNISNIVEQYSHGKMIIATDIEPLKDASGKYIRINGDRIAEYIQLFKAKFKYPSLLYTALWVLSYIDGNTNWLKTEPLWIANYWSSPPKPNQYPKLPPGASVNQLLMHQWTSSYYDGRKWGVASAGLDVNVAYDFQRLMVNYVPEVPTGYYRLVSNSNIRLQPQHDGIAGQYNKLYTLPANTIVDVLEWVEGADYQGVKKWAKIKIDYGFPEEVYESDVYVHSSLLTKA